MKRTMQLASMIRYFTAIWSLYPHVVCNVSVSCNGDRNQLGEWLHSDPKADKCLSLVSVWVHEGLNKI